MAAVERELIRAARRAGAAVRAAVRQDGARSRLHQGLSARHPRERRPVHPCRALVGDGLRAARRGRQGGRACSRMLNPINHARTRADVHRYKVEPYVVAADVYAKAPHVGRGGWTWYTGSAGWMQRAGIESILGIRLEGDHAPRRSLHSEDLAGLRCHASTRRIALRHHRRQSRRRRTGRRVRLH